jgi:hypothetical protein
MTSLQIITLLKYGAVLLLAILVTAVLVPMVLVLGAVIV